MSGTLGLFDEVENLERKIRNQFSAIQSLKRNLTRSVFAAG
jgi:hypothetical protein